jgi:phosphate-selective porin OprO and OprP
MSRMTRVGLLAGAAALTVTGVSVATPATEGNDSALQAEIQRLSARIAELENRNQDNWLTEQRSEEIRSVVHDVLADADTRASLLGSGLTSGYDDGFTIGDAAGNFLLRINGQLQTRYIFNRRRTADRWRSGFENSRTKLWFSGHVVDPSWQYVIETDFARGGRGLVDLDDMDIDFENFDFDEDIEEVAESVNRGHRRTTLLLDAYIKKDMGNGMSIRMGQMKLPFMGENLIDSRYQQAVERSTLAAYFGLGRRSQGLAFDIEQDMFRMTAMWSNGANQANTTWSNFDTEWALTGRGEFRLGGNWDQFNDFRSMPGDEFGMVFGAAAHWEHSEYGMASNKTELFSLTGDANIQGGGFNAYAAVVWAHTSRDIGGYSDEWGILLQGGYNFTDQLEAFGRYEWASLEQPGRTDISILTGGLNYYYAGHRAKATVDLGYAFNTLNAPDSGLNLRGWRGDGGTTSGQWVVRTQLQIAF